MLPNHLKVALRSLVRQRDYSVINIVGLAVGLTVCLLVAAYIVHELSFESCHSKHERIFRAQIDLKTQEMGNFELAGAAPPMGPALQEGCPDVEAFARFRRVDQVKVVAGATVSKNRDVLVVEPDFFRVFDIDVVRGNPVEDMSKPSMIYLTESLAHSLFGRVDPIGQTVSVAGRFEFHVAGILKDFPSNTKLKCDALASYSSLELAGFKTDDWTSIWRDYLFVLVRPGTTSEKLESAMASVLTERLSEDQRAAYTYRAQPLSDLYFNPRPANEMKPIGNTTNMMVFGFIALLTLVIAVVNYVNHATARAAHRAKELGVRKVVGAGRGQVIGQILTESLLVAVAAGVVATTAFEILRPVLDSLLQRRLDVGLVERPSLLLIGAGLAALAGLAGGLYPALCLSRIQPLRLHSSGVAHTSDRRTARRALVVFQFTAAVILSTVAIVVMRQIQYSRAWDKGFDDHDVMVLEMEGDQTSSLIGPLKQELIRQPAVAAVTACDLLPGTQNARLSNFRPAERPDAKSVMIRMMRVDPDFAATLGIKLADGRQLSSDDLSSDGRNIVLDNRAVAELGLTQPVGATLAGDDDVRTVVGVLGNFKTTPTFDQGFPVMIEVNSNALKFVLVKLKPGQGASAVDQIKDSWNRVVPSQPFEYTYLQDVISGLYGDHEKFGALLGTFSGIAVLIACLGILGLVSYAVERRRREIGIRKVVGATVSGIVRLIGSEFVALVVLANVLACPIAWYLSNRWLERFAHRVDLGAGVFLLAGGLALAVAILTVLFQSLKAASANPVESLKYE